MAPPPRPPSSPPPALRRGEAPPPGEPARVREKMEAEIKEDMKVARGAIFI